MKASELQRKQAPQPDIKGTIKVVFSTGEMYYKNGVTVIHLGFDTKPLDKQESNLIVINKRSLSAFDHIYELVDFNASQEAIFHTIKETLNALKIGYSIN